MTVGRFGKETDPGKKRRRNEDAYVVEPPLFAVADGMGGAQAGEVASRLAAEAVRDGSGGVGVVELIQEANRRVYQRSAQDPSVSGMGTTMTLALVDDGEVRIGHVGDSRAYLVRDGSLEQLTEDHSLVAELQRSGKLSAEEAETHPQRSVITRALGTDPDVDVETYTIATRPGDVFLLCSDGLTSMVDEPAILDLIEQNRDDLDRTAKELVRAANKGGGEDNITVVAFEIVDEVADATQETVRMPAAGGDEEDTLDEADGVPVVDTMVIPPEQVQKMIKERPEAEQPPSAQPEPVQRRRETMSWWIVLLFLALVVAGLVVWRQFG